MARTKGAVSEENQTIHVWRINDELLGTQIESMEISGGEYLGTMTQKELRNARKRNRSQIAAMSKVARKK
jgi:hypothetical protein